MRERNSKLRRVLIDCSYINFGSQPSGIPRVVLAYVEVGYEWGRRNDIEVVPVVPTESGLFIVRPIPGRGAPEKLIAATTPASPDRIATPARRHDERPRLLHWIPLSLLHLAFRAITSLRMTSLYVLRDDTRRLIEQVYSPAPPAMAAEETIRIDPVEGDLLFCPAYWHDVKPEIYQGIRRSGAKVVILVHDILPILFAPFYQAPWRYMFRDNLNATFGYAAALFCVSRYTGAALEEIAARENHRKIPVVTAYNGFEPLADIDYVRTYASGTTEHYFGNERLRQVLDDRLAPYVMVGSIEPKKGHIPALRCFAAMWKGGYERNLVIIGRHAWMSDEIVDAIESSPYYGRKLFWFNDLTDFDLAVAYVCSHGLIFCSISEGFGIPMIEASYYEKPTVVFDTPIAREIIGDRGCYFHDGPSFIDRICELEEPGFHAERSRLAQALDWPTWSSYTPRVFDALRDVYDGRSVPSIIPRVDTDSPFKHEAA